MEVRVSVHVWISIGPIMKFEKVSSFIFFGTTRQQKVSIAIFFGIETVTRQTRLFGT